jgi:phosphoenolpyruvate carboxykinase (GTP)
VPRPEAPELDGLSDDDQAKAAQALEVHADEWRRELPTIRKHFDSFGDKLPQELRAELTALDRRLS